MPNVGVPPLGGVLGHSGWSRDSNPIVSSELPKGRTAAFIPAAKNKRIFDMGTSAI